MNFYPFFIFQTLLVFPFENYESWNPLEVEYDRYRHLFHRINLSHTSNFILKYNLIIGVKYGPKILLK